MYTSTIVLGFVAAASAWQLTLYNDSGCNNGGSTDFDYYVYQGTSDACVVVGSGPPSGTDITCEYFTNGGTSEGSCSGQFGTATSLDLNSNFGGDCTVSDGSTTCGGSKADIFTVSGCVANAAQSFTCSGGSVP